MSKATTFCTCIEAGPLEQQIVMLARSLRAFSSPIAKSRFIAVQPRKGVPISLETKRALAGLDVEYVKRDIVGDYAWYDLINKAAAMSWAETHIATDYLTWVDGDIIFARDPISLLPAAEFGFAARPGEADLGTGGDDVNEPYWRKMSDIVGVSYKDAEIIKSIPDNVSIYEYYQSGVYTVHKEEGISQRHFDFMKRMIDAKVASKTCGVYHHDQATLAMAVRGTRRPRIRYDWLLNFNFNMLGEDGIKVEKMPDCIVLHYHGSLHPEFFAGAKKYLPMLPERSQALIRECAPFTVQLPLHTRAARKLVREFRARLKKKYQQACTVY